MTLARCYFCDIPELPDVDLLPGGYWCQDTDWFDANGRAVCDQKEISNISDMVGCDLVKTIRVKLVLLGVWAVCYRCYNAWRAKTEGESMNDVKVRMAAEEQGALLAHGNKGKRIRFVRNAIVGSVWETHIGNQVSSHDLEKYLEELEARSFTEYVYRKMLDHMYEGKEYVRNPKMVYVGWAIAVGLQMEVHDAFCEDLNALRDQIERIMSQHMLPVPFSGDLLHGKFQVFGVDASLYPSNPCACVFAQSQQDMLGYCVELSVESSKVVPSGALREAARAKQRASEW